MIWIASYPRSGNTFVRNLLFHVYGIQSSEYHDEGSQLIYKDLQAYPFVKTHFLPGQLPKKWSSWPSVYIVRDGRDCAVSEAHYRQQLQGSEASYEYDLQLCITAKAETHFGGWSTNVSQWLKKADVVLRFENLIKDPISEMEKIRKVYDLPQPNLSNIPSFESQRQNEALYHGNEGSSKGFEHIENLSSKFYRRGEPNAWKSEMPTDLQIMFWKLHGATMERVGYSEDGHLNELSAVKEQVSSDLKFPIVLNATTTIEDKVDGTRRYEEMLQKGLNRVLKQGSLPFEFFLNGNQVERLTVLNAYDDIIVHEVEKKRSIVALTRGLFNGFLGSIRKLLDKNYHYFQRFCQVTGIKRIYQMITGRLAKIELSTHDQQGLTHYLSANTEVTDEKSLITVHSHTLDSTIQKSNLLSISQQVKRQLEASIPAHNLLHKVVQYGIDHEEFQPIMGPDYIDILDQYGLSHKQYLLLWSSSKPERHWQNYLKAFLKLVGTEGFSNHSIVLAGKYEWHNEELLEHPAVKPIGYVPQEHLAPLYHGAALLYYASQKAFGLPILEGMRCKTIPVYASSSRIEEFLGEYGIATNAESAEDIYFKTKIVLEDPQKRVAMEQACYLQSWDFTLEKMTRQTLDVYKELL